MKKFVLLVAALFVISASNAGAYTFYHWPKYTAGNERTVPVVDYTSGWGVSTAMGQWNPSAYVNLTTGTSTYSCFTAENGKIHACEDWIGVGGYAGITDAYADGNGHLWAANIRLDDADGGLHNSTWKAVVSCHEMGHAIGLYVAGERTEGGSCMYGSISDPPLYSAPDTQDFNYLASNYNHTDRVGQSPLARRAYRISTMVLGPDVAPWFLDKMTEIS